MLDRGLDEEIGGSRRTGWSAAVATVAVLAVVGWLLTANAPGASSTGSGASPRATVAANAVADGLLRDWNSGNATAAAMYARTAEARFAIDSADSTETHIGQAAISDEIVSRASMSTAGSSQGIAVFRLIPTWGTAIQDEWEIGN